MQVKLFWVKSPMLSKGFIGSHNAGKANDFEEHINEWLSQNPEVEIQDIKQSASGGSWSTSLWLVSAWYSLPAPKAGVV